ncbi:hypothetical protein NDU88_001382 [Pleurodeles waltl]|uniref:Uncharacterized protein n=1 Tax=Pleurodeles waltl TaxID=8319 RepID=A0AAV7SZ24_PLEWA|nr:hypothetical protein NDU88_001382 [Pleurodeles waltl]
MMSPALGSLECLFLRRWNLQACGVLKSIRPRQPRLELQPTQLETDFPASKEKALLAHLHEALQKYWDKDQREVLYRGWWGVHRGRNTGQNAGLAHDSLAIRVTAITLEMARSTLTPL